MLTSACVLVGDMWLTAIVSKYNWLPACSVGSTFSRVGTFLSGLLGLPLGCWDLGCWDLALDLQTLSQ